MTPTLRVRATTRAGQIVFNIPARRCYHLRSRSPDRGQSTSAARASRTTSSHWPVYRCYRHYGSS